MRLSQKIPSRLEIINDVLPGIIDKIKALPIDETDLFNIKLALGEALVNAIKHGNSLNPKLAVYFDLEARPDRVIVKVRDEGSGFDYSKVPDPTKDGNLGKGRGRGVFLIRKLMDEVSYSDSGRVITMVKLLKKGASRENQRK